MDQNAISICALTHLNYVVSWEYGFCVLVLYTLVSAFSNQNHGCTQNSPLRSTSQFHAIFLQLLKNCVSLLMMSQQLLQMLTVVEKLAGSITVSDISFFTVLRVKPETNLSYQ